MKGNNINKITAADIEKYWKGELTLAQMHAIEKAAMDDPFLSDALEGYKNSNAITADIEDIKQRLSERTENVIPLRSPYPWLRVAAAILIISVLGYFGSQMISGDEGKIAERSKTETAPVADTINNVQTSIPDTQPGISQNQSVKIENEISGFDKKTPAPDRMNPDSNISYMKTGDVPTASPPESKSMSRNEEVYGVRSSKPDTISELAGTGRSQSDDMKSESFKEADKNRSKRQSIPASNTAGMTNFYRGRVVDTQNNPVPFANVTNTRDQVGTYTDMKGNFNLLSGDSVLDLRIRSVGFETRTYRVAPRSAPTQLVMEEDAFAKGASFTKPLPHLKLTPRQRMDSLAEVEGEIEPEVGWGNYNTYLANNIKIPEIRDGNNNKDIELSFQVDQAGQPSNIKITRSSKCKECDNAAIKALKEGPKWKSSSKKARTSVTIAVQ